VADAADQVMGAGRAGNPPCDRGQQLVDRPEAVPELERGKVVEGDDRHRQGPLVAPGPLDLLRQPSAEGARAQQPRQAVESKVAGPLGFQLRHALAQPGDLVEQAVLGSSAEHPDRYRQLRARTTVPRGQRGQASERRRRMSSSMIVLGIDPGTASTGYGVLESVGSRLRALDHGVIETSAGVSLERRLSDIHLSICALLDEHAPDAMAIEELYFGANVRTAFAVGQARGVVLLAAGQRGVASRSYTPQQVKSAVCGSGRADKDQVGRMVARLLGLAAPPSPDHAADALAVAICEANRSPLAVAVMRA
jgi:crossover junction endodeoxyribonuclease RuvC